MYFELAVCLTKRMSENVTDYGIQLHGFSNRLSRVDAPNIAPLPLGVEQPEALDLAKNDAIRI